MISDASKLWLVSVTINAVFPSAKVLEMRNAENQVVPEDPRVLGETSSGPAPQGEPACRPSHHELPHTELSSQAPFTLNFSFEELNSLGLDEGAPRHSHLSWQVATATSGRVTSVINLSQLCGGIDTIIQKLLREPLSD